jgi:hypothetical protein
VKVTSWPTTAEEVPAVREVAKATDLTLIFTALELDPINRPEVNS